MKYVALNLTAISPLAIRADHAPGGVASAGYIAGSALMGSLAAVYRLFYEDRTTEFEELFLRERILYPNLYPATFQNPLMQKEQAWPVYPPPLTARTCKRFSGFQAGGDDEQHGVRDSLFDWATFELARMPGKARPTAGLLAILHDQKVCENCKRAMKPFTQFYRRGEGSNAQMMASLVHKRVQTHTGINRETGTVQDGILYSREVFEEQMRFWGLAKVSEELTAPFTDFLARIGQSGLLRIGTGRTRGLGKVELTTLPLDDEPYGFTAFKQRVEAFDRAFHKRAQAARLTLEPDHFYFALTLHAPTILRDNLLRYRSCVDEIVLAELTGLPADSFQAVYQATSPRRVTGWSELWGTPRGDEYAMETSSVFFFASLIGSGEKLLQKLFHLEQEGIGQRRDEGFGRICVSDPFHLEVKLR